MFTTAGAGVHPDHKALTDIVTHGVFYSRLPKWDEVPGGEAFEGSEPHEIDRLFFGHCRMEPAWDPFDLAVDSGCNRTCRKPCGLKTGKTACPQPKVFRYLWI